MSAPNITISGVTYSGVKGVTLPQQGGGTATFPWVEGSETKTENGTYDVTNLAQMVVNVSGGGTDRLVLLQTTALGPLSTSSTAAKDTGKTVSLEQTTGWQNYDLLLVDISVDTPTNDRHTSTVTPVFRTNTVDRGMSWNSRLNPNGNVYTSYGSGYGVFIEGASVSSGTLILTVYYRYRSASTGTIDGTYTARVYGIKLLDLIGG